MRELMSDLTFVEVVCPLSNCPDSKSCGMGAVGAGEGLIARGLTAGVLTLAALIVVREAIESGTWEELDLQRSWGGVIVLNPWPGLLPRVD